MKARADKKSPTRLAYRVLVSIAFSFFSGLSIGAFGSMASLNPVLISMLSGTVTGIGVAVIFAGEK